MSQMTAAAVFRRLHYSSASRAPLTRSSVQMLDETICQDLLTDPYPRLPHIRFEFLSPPPALKLLENISVKIC